MSALNRPSSSSSLPRPTSELDPSEGTDRSSTVNQDRGPADGKEGEGRGEYGAQAAGGAVSDPYEVKFAEDDPANPKTWSRAYRWYLTTIGGLLVLNATFASSCPTGIIPVLRQRFHFGQEVSALLIAIFVAGFCVGPFIWGPASEAFGRRPIFLVSFFIYTGFQVGCALSNNTGSILVFRFLAGVFSAAPLSNSGALIADVWDVQTRGTALAVFCVAPFAGPALGPLVGGYMEVAGVSWRWVFWLLTFFAGACFFTVLFTVPETYVPILLVKRARQLRKETGDDRWWAPMERKSMTIGQRIHAILTRPFVMLGQEPMLIALTAYMSFVYGCIYLLFEAYPIVFAKGHHFNQGENGLAFLPLFIGAISGMIIYAMTFGPRYKRKIAEFAPRPVPPEERLVVALFAAPMFTISFFWFGWTSYPSVSYWAPMMSGLTLGLSISWIFLSLINYTIDAYLFASASALAAQTVCRSLFGAGFPLFATQMFNTLNPRWASSLLGFIALAMSPIPFVLIKFGPTLRRRSKFAPTLNIPPPKPTKSESEAV